MTELLHAITEDLQGVNLNATVLLNLSQDNWDLSDDVNMHVILQSLERISTGMGVAVRDSLAALEVVSQDVLYTSNLVGSYHLLAEEIEHRQVIYDTYLVSLRARIVQLKIDTLALNQRLNVEYRDDERTWTQQLGRLWLLASAKSSSDTSRGNAAMSNIQETAAGIPRLTGGFTSIIDKLDECEGMLHRDFVHSWHRSWEHSHAVRTACTMRHQHEQLYRAAAQEVGKITSPGLLALIDAFCGCIQAYLHDTPLRGVSLGTLGLRRAAAVEAYIEAIARRQIHDLTESSPGNRTEAELEAMLQARIAQIRDDIAQDPDVGGNAESNGSSSSSDGFRADSIGDGEGVDREMDDVVSDVNAVGLG
ncbi:hypothetical protein N0V82_007461 [Gnomoniopsis sp. IMI 355080]|nr:hypothetical protein N0V82_007461 [Gnomoniopsis sp. IMI 355080]